MASHFKTPDYIHSNRISRLEVSKPTFKLGYEERPFKGKYFKSQPSRHFDFVDTLTEGTIIETTHLGNCQVKSVDSRTGHQVIEVLVKGTAGLRRETIYPLHIRSIVKTKEA